MPAGIFIVHTPTAPVGGTIGQGQSIAFEALMAAALSDGVTPPAGPSEITGAIRPAIRAAIRPAMREVD